MASGTKKNRPKCRQADSGVDIWTVSAVRVTIGTCGGVLMVISHTVGRCRNHRPMELQLLRHSRRLLKNHSISTEWCG